MILLKALLFLCFSIGIFCFPILETLFGLVAWTVVWSVICLTHNVVVSGAEPWQYLGFWKSLNFSWEQTKQMGWGNVGHIFMSFLFTAALNLAGRQTKPTGNGAAGGTDTGAATKSS